MKVTEALAALKAAVEDIANEAREAGFTAELRSRYADIDFNESDEYMPEAKIIFAELTVGLEGASDSMIYECAVGISEGECSDDEIASEIASMRSSVRELIEKICSAPDRLAAFCSELDETDGEEPAVQEPVRDNKKFYIVASIVAAVLLLGAVIISALAR